MRKSEKIVAKSVKTMEKQKVVPCATMLGVSRGFPGRRGLAWFAWRFSREQPATLRPRCTADVREERLRCSR